MSENCVEAIRQRLTDAFAPERLEIIDDTHKHVGHASAKGGGHFTVQVIAEAFEGKKPLERHRMVYDALGDLMQGEIHALSIKAEPPVKS